MCTPKNDTSNRSSFAFIYFLNDKYHSIASKNGLKSQIYVKKNVGNIELQIGLIICRV